MDPGPFKRLKRLVLSFVSTFIQLLPPDKVLRFLFRLAVS